MVATVKDMLSAARAPVPAITPADTADLAKSAEALIVNVPNGTGVAGRDRLKAALAVSRGLLEFRADPALPSHEP